MSLGAFDRARESHSKVYPPAKNEEVDNAVLTEAAAFEGMHHWEHVQRQKGEPISRNAAMGSLISMVTDEARRLYDAGPMGVFNDKKDRDIFGLIAENEAIKLYDAQYGADAEDVEDEEDWGGYDPRQMSPHRTMAGEWVDGWVDNKQDDESEI